MNIKNINIKSICATLFISLFLSCNNGIEELEKRNTFLSSLANLGNDFLSVFTSFGDMFSSSLGLKADSKKSDVATYFKKVQDTLENTKTALNKIVTDMKTQENPNAAGVETAVTTLNEKLNKIIEGAKIASGAIGDAGDQLIGNVAKGGGSDKAGVVGTEVDKLVKGIKTIVDIVLKNEGNADAGDDRNAKDGSQRGNNAGEAGNLFANDKAGTDDTAVKKVATDAAKAVGAVTGADILKAMIKDGGGSAKLAKHDGLANTITTGSGVAQNAKDATIAGGIALRAMARGGKFANESTSPNTGVVAAVKGAAVSAVTKALDTLTIAIRKTIDEGLKTVKEAMKINPDDTSVTSEAGAVTK
nr:variable large family protein [Borrelia coriaceae]